MVDLAVLVAVIVGVGKLLKSVEIFPTKFIPLVNIVLGVIGGVVYLHPGNIEMAILDGIIAGLTAGGFYSSVKNVLEGVRHNV